MDFWTETLFPSEINLSPSSCSFTVCKTPPCFHSFFYISHPASQLSWILQNIWCSGSYPCGAKLFSDPLFLNFSRRVCLELSLMILPFLLQWFEICFYKIIKHCNPSIISVNIALSEFLQYQIFRVSLVGVPETPMKLAIIQKHRQISYSKIIFTGQNDKL